MTTHPPRIRYVEYNNKSRKGTYIGIKETGKRERFYKALEGVPLDIYLEAHKEQWKPGTIRRTYQNWQQLPTPPVPKRQPTTRKKESLKAKLAPGNTKVTVQLEQLNRPGTIRRIEKKLYEPLLKDKKEYDTIISNKRKLRNIHSVHNPTTPAPRKERKHLSPHPYL